MQTFDAPFLETLQLQVGQTIPFQMPSLLYLQELTLLNSVYNEWSSLLFDLPTSLTSLNLGLASSSQNNSLFDSDVRHLSNLRNLKILEIAFAVCSPFTLKPFTILTR